MGAMMNEIERPIKAEVDLIYTGYWDGECFCPESVRLADEDFVLTDPDIIGEIDHEIRQERFEAGMDAAEYRNDLFYELCHLNGFLPPN